MKLWRKATQYISIAEGDGGVDWSSASVEKLTATFHMGLAHAGWSMEQYAQTGDPMFLDEVLYGLDTASLAASEKRRRAG